jgi:signal transduction histidine kinase
VTPCFFFHCSMVWPIMGLGQWGHKGLGAGRVKGSPMHRSLSREDHPIGVPDRLGSEGGGGGRLLRRTFVIAFVLVSGGLLTSGAVELYFRYRESVEAIEALQREMAQGAAFKIQQFVADIEKTLRSSTQVQEVVSAGLTEAYRFELIKLLKVAPAITEAVAVDADGQERYKVSRVRMLLPEELRDLSAAEVFIRARTGRSYFGQIFFVRESEPYMTIAVPIERFAGDVVGVLVAEVNLKYIWEVVSRIKVGRAGYAYVVSREGDLIAHPDISLVLQKRRVKDLPQVQAALGGETRLLGAQPNLAGQEVFASSATIPDLGWAVLVERPAAEAYAPLYASLLRISTLLLLGLGMAILSSLLIGRRVVRPVGILRQGASRIGAGDLNHRLEINTGDELQALAEEFNHMASRLQESYANLEQKVEERTQQLEIASRHKSQFLANMSHELRTPLNAILGYTELILDNVYGEPPEKVREVLDRVHKSGQHLLSLINAVLDLSKIEAGELQLSISEYALQDVVYTAVASVESLATEKHLRLTVDVSPDLPPAQGDERRVVQVLLNLLGNAIKFTDDGDVRIRATAAADGFLVSVSDSGPGISDEDQAKIFEAFQQADSTSTKQKGGTGLGLSIAKRIVEMHGGRIWVESRLGKGSTFWVSLPVHVGRRGGHDE